MTQPDPQTPRVDGPGDWHRLSAWMMLEETPGRVPQFLGVVVGLASLFLGIPGIVPIVVGALAAVVAAVPIWLATTYQVTDQHVRVRSGVIRRKAATARRDRIRSVETTASPLNRVLGLETVTIRTGADASSSAVVLYCVRKQYAIALRDYLMPTGTPAAPDTADPDSPDNGQAPDVAVPLAGFEPRWLRFAAFSNLGFTVAAAALMIGARLAYEVARPDEERSGSWDLPSDLSISLTVSIAVAVIVFGAAASVLSYLFEFGHFLLSRHRDGTLRIRRGLLTTTSTTLDEKRIRGIRIHEPPLMRPLRGARLHAIATGADKQPLLLPLTPTEVVGRVGRAVFGAGGDAAQFPPQHTIPDRPGDHGALKPHPPAARRRRITRTVASALAVSVIPLIAWALGWLPLTVAITGLVVLVCAGAALGELRYRNLGHRLTDHSLVIAPPTAARQRYLLHDDGIIGWSVRASWFQRRQGLVTLVAASAAGTEAYRIVDIHGDDASALAAEISPGLIEPFLHR